MILEVTYSLDERVAVHMLSCSLEGVKIIQHLLMQLSTLVYQARPSLTLTFLERERLDKLLSTHRTHVVLEVCKSVCKGSLSCETHKPTHPPALSALTLLVHVVATGGHVIGCSGRSDNHCITRTVHCV